VIVEKKCVEIDEQQSQTSNIVSDEQWQALIALHRTLLHEHHDFFLASQHPVSRMTSSQSFNVEKLLNPIFLLAYRPCLGQDYPSDHAPALCHSQGLIFPFLSHKDLELIFITIPHSIPSHGGSGGIQCTANHPLSRLPVTAPCDR
jgi:hypothetical protein